MGKKRVAQKGIDSEKKTEPKTVTSVSSRKKKKKERSVENGRIYIASSYNNTKITVTDEKGDVVAWATAGAMGFSGPKKATPFAASNVMRAIVEKVGKNGPHKVDVYVSGIGPGRDSAIRSLTDSGFDVLSISDITPVPHNGPRAKKPRRV